MVYFWLGQLRPELLCLVAIRTGKRGVGAVSGSAPGSLSQVNSAPGSFLPFFAPKRDMAEVK